MQDSTTLSVTIATYNVEDFIKESIESVLNQTFTDFEVICIDDGSKDNTVAILNEYASLDKRIKVIAKNENQGLAVARNESLALAKGKYVVFFDGDDIYDKTLFEKAISILEKENNDMVIWDYVSFFETNEIDSLKKQKSPLETLEVTNKIALLQRPSFTWVKMIKTETAKKLGIYFPPGYTRQDIPVHWHLITKLETISLLPEKLSFYRQQPNATTAKKNEKLFHLAYVLDIVKEYLKENQEYETYKAEFLRQQLNLLFGMYDNIKEDLKPQAKQLIADRLFAEHYEYIHSGKPLRKQAKYFYLSLKGNLWAKIKLSIWYTSRFIFRKIKSV